MENVACKCNVNLQIFLQRFLPIEKSMFSGLTKLPKNFCSDKDELECDRLINFFEIKFLSGKSIECEKVSWY